jgi:hypothetical protein
LFNFKKHPNQIVAAVEEEEVIMMEDIAVVVMVVEEAEVVVVVLVADLDQVAKVHTHSTYIVFKKKKF